MYEAQLTLVDTRAQECLTLFSSACLLGKGGGEEEGTEHINFNPKGELVE